MRVTPTKLDFLYQYDSRPEGPKAGPEGRKLEVGARRAPRLLVHYICQTRPQSAVCYLRCWNDPLKSTTFAKPNLSQRCVISGALGGLGVNPGDFPLRNDPLKSTTFAKPNLSQRCVISGALGGRGRSLLAASCLSSSLALVRPMPASGEADAVMPVAPNIVRYSHQIPQLSCNIPTSWSISKQPNIDFSLAHYDSTQAHPGLQFTVRLMQ